MFIELACNVDIVPNLIIAELVETDSKSPTLTPTTFCFAR